MNIPATTMTTTTASTTLLPDGVALSSGSLKKAPSSSSVRLLPHSWMDQFNALNSFWKLNNNGKMPHYQLWKWMKEQAKNRNNLTNVQRSLLQSIDFFPRVKKLLMSSGTPKHTWRESPVVAEQQQRCTVQLEQATTSEIEQDDAKEERHNNTQVQDEEEADDDTDQFPLDKKPKPGGDNGTVQKPLLKRQQSLSSVGSPRQQKHLNKKQKILTAPDGSIKQLSSKFLARFKPSCGEPVSLSCSLIWDDPHISMFLDPSDKWFKVRCHWCGWTCRAGPPFGVVCHLNKVQGQWFQPCNGDIDEEFARIYKAMYNKKQVFLESEPSILSKKIRHQKLHWQEWQVNNTSFVGDDEQVADTRPQAGAPGKDSEHPANIITLPPTKFIPSHSEHATNKDLTTATVETGDRDCASQEDGTPASDTTAGHQQPCPNNPPAFLNEACENNSSKAEESSAKNDLSPDQPTGVARPIVDPMPTPSTAENGDQTPLATINRDGLEQPKAAKESQSDKAKLSSKTHANLFFGGTEEEAQDQASDKGSSMTSRGENKLPNTDSIAPHHTQGKKRTMPGDIHSIWDDQMILVTVDPLYCAKVRVHCKWCNQKFLSNGKTEPGHEIAVLCHLNKIEKGGVQICTGEIEAPYLERYEAMLKLAVRKRKACEGLLSISEAEDLVEAGVSWREHEEVWNNNLEKLKELQGVLLERFHKGNRVSLDGADVIDNWVKVQVLLAQKDLLEPERRSRLETVLNMTEDLESNDFPAVRVANNANLPRKEEAQATEAAPTCINSNKESTPPRIVEANTCKLPVATNELVLDSQTDTTEQQSQPVQVPQSGSHQDDLGQRYASPDQQRTKTFLDGTHWKKLACAGNLPYFRAKELIEAGHRWQEHDTVWDKKIKELACLYPIMQVEQESAATESLRSAMDSLHNWVQVQRLLREKGLLSQKRQQELASVGGELMNLRGDMMRGRDSQWLMAGLSSAAKNCDPVQGCLTNMLYCHESLPFPSRKTQRLESSTPVQIAAQNQSLSFVSDCSRHIDHSLHPLERSDRLGKQSLGGPNVEQGGLHLASSKQGEREGLFPTKVFSWVGTVKERDMALSGKLSLLDAQRLLSRGGRWEETEVSWNLHYQSLMAIYNLMESSKVTGQKSTLDPTLFAELREWVQVQALMCEMGTLQGERRTNFLNLLSKVGTSLHTGVEFEPPRHTCCGGQAIAIDEANSGTRTGLERDRASEGDAHVTAIENAHPSTRADLEVHKTSDVDGQISAINESNKSTRADLGARKTLEGDVQVIEINDAEPSSRADLETPKTSKGDVQVIEINGAKPRSRADLGAPKTSKGDLQVIDINDATPSLRADLDKLKASYDEAQDTTINDTSPSASRAATSTTTGTEKLGFKEKDKQQAETDATIKRKRNRPVALDGATPSASKAGNKAAAMRVSERSPSENLGGGRTGNVVVKGAELPETISRRKPETIGEHNEMERAASQQQSNGSPSNTHEKEVFDQQVSGLSEHANASTTKGLPAPLLVETKMKSGYNSGTNHERKIALEKRPTLRIRGGKPCELDKPTGKRRLPINIDGVGRKGGYVDGFGEKQRAVNAGGNAPSKKRREGTGERTTRVDTTTKNEGQNASVPPPVNSPTENDPPCKQAPAILEESHKMKARRRNSKAKAPRRNSTEKAPRRNSKGKATDRIVRGERKLPIFVLVDDFDLSDLYEDEEHEERTDAGDMEVQNDNERAAATQGKVINNHFGRHIRPKPKWLYPNYY